MADTMTHVPIWWDSYELCQKQASNVRFFFVWLHTELSSVYSFRRDFFFCAIPSLISEQLSERNAKRTESSFSEQLPGLPLLWK